ncbi:hypothetical protein FIBSPDRAFT_861449 [Athelia psychrophila]|uniref:Mis12-Mtw1 protein n=1 Tax=Athelia psychrophila TaxID=1759441 RepID=A0A166JCB1_9AGAM|nr:hypothetical protein FIBSPDRAFT_861449 [Fibularhizoctonia sp. CBS 109695]
MTSTKTVQSSTSTLTVDPAHPIQLTTTVTSNFGMDKDSNPKPTAKRKAHDDSNPLLNAAKRAKKDSKAGASNKRKLNGVEDIGGLRIVRASSARPPSAAPLSQDPSRPSQSQPVPQHPPVQPSHPRQTSQPPPTKKFRASPMPPETPEEDGLDEDVRQMQSETDGLRNQSSSSLAAESALNPAFNFPPRAPSSQPGSKPKASAQAKKPRRTRDTHVDSRLEVPEAGDTPQMERNKAMRNGHPSMSQQAVEGSSTLAGKKAGKDDAKKGHERRKSSISNRGKRISSLFEGGVASQPHTSVSNTSFYKHIDSELPEPARARQLLVWCSARATAKFKANAKPPSKSAKGKGKDTDEAEIVAEVQEDLVRMLVDKEIDTTTFSHSADATPTDVLAGTGLGVKPNEQNIKNRVREQTFGGLIARRKAEEAAWLDVANYYNTYQASALAEMQKRAPPGTGANGKGKQKATPQEMEAWSSPRDSELPEAFRGKTGVALARSVLEDTGGAPRGPNSERLGELEFKVDSLHSYLHSALQTTNAAAEDLDARFSVLSLALAARSALPQPMRSTSTAASLISAPALAQGPSATHEPQDLLRALARMDAHRPPAQIGDAARRAVREVQRVGPAAGAERRLTVAAPATPRKSAGTPRRGGTPGKERERA